MGKISLRIGLHNQGQRTHGWAQHSTSSDLLIIAVISGGNPCHVGYDLLVYLIFMFGLA